MAQPRPTFSEHWHRVASLRPSLRASVQSYRQHYRGQLWHVVRDPTTNRYLRLDEPSFRFVGMLDGRRTTDAVWRACCEQLGDRAPTQNEAVQLLGQLYAHNFLVADLPGDATALFERRRKRVRREVGQYVTNLLFARIPLWNPDRFLDRWAPLVGWCFGPVGVALWLAVMWFGLSALAGRGDELWSQSANVLSPDNLPWLYAAGVVVKLIHEFGHGFACKHFGRKHHNGGRVYTMGVMLLVLVPMPYVDASSAWALRSKWRRIFISAAGMYAELAIAALAAVVWSRTAAGTFWHGFAYNMIFTAGVSTVLFNINPLIRFDGYYILSDLTDTPNLMQRSKATLHYFVKKYAFGVRHPYQPATGPVEMAWLTVYAVASAIYRVFLSIGILLFVADKLFFLGILMAATAIIGWVVVPVGKFVHYLAVHPELLKTRSRAVAVTVATLALLGLGLGVAPAPDHGRAEGVVEARAMAAIHAAADGEARVVLASGSRVGAAGDVLVAADNRELRAEQEQLTAQLAALRHRHHQALARDPATAQSFSEQIAALRQQVARVEKDLANLTIAAPIEGVWMATAEDLLPGAVLQRGQPLGLVVDTSDLYVRVTADQYLGPRLRAELASPHVELRARRQPELYCTGEVRRVIPGGRRELPSAALGIAGGGALAVRMHRESTGVEAAEPFFEVDVELTDAHAARLLPGQRVVARFRLPDAPLAVQLWRAVRQTLQERFQV